MDILISRVFIVLALLFSLLQSTKTIKIRGSQVNYFWLFAGVLIYFITEILLYTFSVPAERSILILVPLAVAYWINLIKFTLGYIQKKEIPLFNRFEHFMGGLLLFYFFAVIRVLEQLSVSDYSVAFEGLFYFLLVNLGSVVNELVELWIDVKHGKNYMIGPEITDTNFDLLSTFTGGLVGYLIFLFVL